MTRFRSGGDHRYIEHYSVCLPCMLSSSAQEIVDEFLGLGDCSVPAYGDRVATVLREIGPAKSGGDKRYIYIYI